MLFYKLFHLIIKKFSSMHLFINIYLYCTLYILSVYTINKKFEKILETKIISYRRYLFYDDLKRSWKPVN